MSNGHPLGWDDEIGKDGEGYPEALPKGVYPFEIVNLARGRFQPNEKRPGKLPACPKATITVRLKNPDGTKASDLTTDLFLHSICEGILCSFFVCLGHRKHGEPLRPNWNRVIGSKGWCKLDIEKWTGNDGIEREQNRIVAWLDPEKVKDVPPPQAAAPAAQPTYQPPQDDTEGF